MSAMTGQDLLNACKGNLGNRDSGVIGAQSVDDAVLDSINETLYIIAKRYNVETLQRNALIDVTSSAYKYVEPILDENDITISVKSYIILVLKQDDETVGKPLIRLSTQRRDKTFPITSSNMSGRPGFYSIFAGYIELYPYPDDDYTIYARTNVWPIDFDSTNIGNPNPLGEWWDDVVEAGATAKAFSKLQQVKDAQLWYHTMEHNLRATLRALRELPDWQPDMAMLSGIHPSAPWDNPFVHG